MIRLARVGKTKKPYFRLIVSEKNKDTHGDYLESLGHINPHANPRATELKTDRIKYWLGVGAQASPSVRNMLIEAGVMSGEKLRVWKAKKKLTEETPATQSKPADAKTELTPAASKPAEAKVEEPAPAAS